MFDQLLNFLGGSKGISTGSAQAQGLSPFAAAGPGGSVTSPNAGNTGWINDELMGVVQSFLGMGPNQQQQQQQQPTPIVQGVSSNEPDRTRALLPSSFIDDDVKLENLFTRLGL